MKVDWTKPIEAVEKATGRVVPMTFARNNAGAVGDKFATKEAPCNSMSNEYWKEDGTDCCHHDKWFIRNVKPEGRTFLIDHRTSNPGLHKLYLETALDILETIEDCLARLDDFSNINASGFAGDMRRERAALVNSDAAFFEAAAMRYAGVDWLQEAEKNV